MKKTTTNPEKLYFTYPNTVAVICTKDRDQVYVMPAVWQIPLSHSPPIFGVLVSPKRFTHQKIFEAKNFTVNYLTFDNAELITQIGSCSGRDVNKIKHFGMKLAPAKMIASPRLKDAYVSLECASLQTQTFGDHTLFAGEIKNIWYEDTFFSDNILNQKAEPLLYLGNLTYSTFNSKKTKKCQKQIF